MRFEPFTQDASAQLAVGFRRTANGFRGEAELRDAKGEKRWTIPVGPDPDCWAAMGGLALWVAEKLDPSYSPPTPVSAPRAPHRVFDDGPPPEPPPASPPVAAPPAEISASRPVFQLGLATSLDLGAAPRPALGLATEAGVRWSPVSLALEARWDPPASRDMGHGERLVTSRITGALVPCYLLRPFGPPERPFLLMCGLLAIGTIRGSGNAAHVESDTELYGAAGGRLGLQVPLPGVLTPHVAAVVSGDVLGVWKRVTFRFDGQIPWATPALTGNLEAGLRFTF